MVVMAVGRVQTRVREWPHVGVFHVLLYNDAYCASLHEVWRIVVHSLLK